MRSARDAGVPPLGAAEEARLARLIEAGVIARAVLDGDGPRADASTADLERVEAEGRAARQQFLLSHTRFIWSLAWSEANRYGIDADDLLQEGFLAANSALNRFDPALGRFSTFAYRGIQARIREFAASRGGAVGLSASQAITLQRARAIEARMTAETGRRPDAAQVAAELGRSQAWTAELLAHQFPALMGDNPTWDNHLLAPGPGEQEQFPGIVAGMKTLSNKQRDAIALRFGFSDGHPHTYQEIADQMGIPPSDARRTCEAALTLLRDADAHERLMMSGPGASAATPEQLAVLPRVDRFTAMGLSLLEVAMAAKTEPQKVVEAVQAGGRKDLMARLVGAERRLNGARSVGSDVLAEAIRHDAEAHQTQRAIRNYDAETDRLRDAIQAQRETPEAKIERLTKQADALRQENARLKLASMRRGYAPRPADRARTMPVTAKPPAPPRPQPVPALSL